MAWTDLAGMGRDKAAAAPKPKAPTPKPKPSTPVKQKVDANKLIQQQFEQEGLGDFASVIYDWLVQGYTPQEVQIMLPDTQVYKERFKANDQRKKKGLRVLSPAEYIANENAYKNMMRTYGLPKGFYDQQSDFQRFLENDVSPQEMDSRIQAAKATVISDNPTIRETYRAWYAQGLSEGDAIAAVLDPTKALPELEKKARAAALGGAASQQGVGIDRDRAEYLASMGAQGQNALQGFGQVADIQRNAGTLASRYGMEYGGQSDAEDAVFLNDSSATNRIKKLGQRESEQFGGRGVGDSRSLGGRSF